MDLARKLEAQVACVNPASPAIMTPEASFTYSQLWKAARRVEQVAARSGVTSADTVLCRISGDVFRDLSLILGLLRMSTNVALWPSPQKGLSRGASFLKVEWIGSFPREDGNPQFIETAVAGRSERGEIRAHGELWLQTSGTVGVGRWVRLSGAAVAHNIAVNSTALCIHPGQVTLLVLPLYHSYGLIGQALSHLYSGATIAATCNGTTLITSYSLRQLCDLFRPTNVFLVPRLARMIAFVHSELSLSEAFLPAFAVGGGTLDRQTFMKLFALSESGLAYITYGLTEAGPRVTLREVVRETLGETTNVGRPLPGVSVRLLNGSLLVKTPSVMSGYAQSCLEPLRSGWLETGDRGAIHSDGSVSVIGRTSRTIQIAGRSFQLEEFERLLLSSGGLLDARAAWDAASGRLVIRCYPFPGCQLHVSRYMDAIQTNFGLDDAAVSVLTMARSEASGQSLK